MFASCFVRAATSGVALVVLLSLGACAAQTDEDQEDGSQESDVTSKKKKKPVAAEPEPELPAPLEMRQIHSAPFQMDAETMAHMLPSPINPDARQATYEVGSYSFGITCGYARTNWGQCTLDTLVAIEDVRDANGDVAQVKYVNQSVSFVIRGKLAYDLAVLSPEVEVGPLRCYSEGSDSRKVICDLDGKRMDAMVSSWFAVSEDGDAAAAAAME